MLLAFFQWLSQDIRAFSVFNYLSLRAVMAALTALLIGFSAGPWVIRELRKLKIGQAVRTCGPKTHLVKDGTPTMGGSLILISIGLSTLLWMDLSNRFVWAVLFVTLGYGIVGWVDDYRKVVHHNPNGMSAREKFGWQSVIGVITAVYLAFAVSMPTDTHVWSLVLHWFENGFVLPEPAKLQLTVPFFKQIAFPLRHLGIPNSHLHRDRRNLKRRQPHRRLGRSRHPALRDGGVGAGDFLLRRGASRLRQLPLFFLYSRGRRIGSRVRGFGRCGARVPVV